MVVLIVNHLYGSTLLPYPAFYPTFSVIILRGYSFLLNDKSGVTVSSYIVHLTPFIVCTFLFSAVIVSWSFTIHHSPFTIPKSVSRFWILKQK